MESQTGMQIAEALGNLAIRMQGQANPDETLRVIVDAAAYIVPGISWAGVCVVEGKSVRPGAPTDRVAEKLDRLQSTLGEGPALDALAEQHTVVIPDLAAETRWPRFGPAAVEMGVRCLAAFRLFVDDGALGAFTLYGPTPNMFDDDAVLYGEILAQHAAVAVAGACAEAQAQRAIASRDVIGQAKGIIMERFHVDAVTAFGMLTKLSQDSNTKLIDVAKQVIETTDTTSGRAAPE